ncbi:MAG: PAS domain-containing sensor histidine kinase, partial [Cyanobacteriota bacterium]|nr:PAS domain-containing sensor histidine kinase [Cyanobacteriota bacterium]
MISIVKKLLSNRYEYLTLDRNFLILDVSPSAQRFAEIPDELQLGNDVRLSFPELIGLEETLLNILEGKQISFEL